MKTITVEFTKTGKTVEYSTNNEGKGLWLDGKQIAGHADFNANSPSELMRKLKSGTDQTMEKMTMVRGSAKGW